MTPLREAIADADAVLFATPEYNRSIPGFLKNALDWISRPIAESPLRARTSPSSAPSTGMFGAVWAQAELRKVLGALGARVVDRELPLTLGRRRLARVRRARERRPPRGAGASTSARCSARSRSPRTRRCELPRAA